MIRLESSVEFDLLRLLSFMFVVRSYKYMQVPENFATQFVLGQHATHGIFYQRKRLAIQLLFGSSRALTSWVPRVTDVLFGVPLVSGQNNFLCVHYDHEVSTVRVRREIGLVFAAKALSNFRRKTAQRLALSIDEQPLLFSVLLVDGDGFVAQSIHSSVF